MSGAVPIPLDDPEHWRQRAQEMRALAEDTKDPESKRRMLEVADGYDGLAQRAEERRIKPPESN
jgi:hypothetical protein